MRAFPSTIDASRATPRLMGVLSLARSKEQGKARAQIALSRVSGSRLLGEAAFSPVNPSKSPVIPAESRVSPAFSPVGREDSKVLWRLSWVKFPSTPVISAVSHSLPRILGFLRQLVALMARFSPAFPPISPVMAVLPPVPAPIPASFSPGFDFPTQNPTQP